MNTLLDILMNLSPLILIIFVRNFLKMLDEEKKYIKIIRYMFFYGLCIYFGLFPYLYSSGYGNTILIIIVQLIFCAGFVTISDWLIADKVSLFSIVFASMCVIYVITASVNVYYRLRKEEIIKIEFVDELLIKLSNTNYLKIVYNVFDNKWFEEITIGVISAVIAGLLLDRIKKNK